MTRLSWTALVLAVFLTSACMGIWITKDTASSIVVSTSISASTTALVEVKNDSSSTSTTTSFGAAATTSSTQSTQTPTSTPSKVIPSTVPPATATSTTPIEPVAPVIAPTEPTLPSSGSVGLDTAATLLRGALVNIVCYVPAGSGLHSISGSGIIIDQKGIILTNAHVAQYFLLKDRGASCFIRSGSPAQNAYVARLIYISPIWIQKNTSVLTEVSPTGTGENDFALLGITQSVTSTPLPAFFPYIPLATTPPEEGAQVVIASFGAQFLSTTQVQSSLFPTVVFGSVKKVFTFATNTIDVVDLGGSAAAQEGSSGGGIATAGGTLAGTITTSTVEGSTDTRSLSAITASYIRGQYATETGNALDVLLSESISSSISAFAPKMPALEALITAQLP